MGDDDLTKSKERIHYSYHKKRASLELDRASSAKSLVAQTLAVELGVEAGRKFSARIRKRRLKFDTLARIVDSRTFAILVFFVILANCIFTGWTIDVALQESIDTFHARQLGGQPATSGLSNIVVGWDFVFTSLFLLEVVLRVVAQEGDFILGPDNYWNMFDTLVALLAIWDTIFSWSNTTTFIRGLRVLKVSRALRTVRLLRIAPFMYKLRLMILACVHSINALFWTSTIFALLIFMFAIVFAGAAVEYLDGASTSDETSDTVLVHFNTLPQAMLSLFMSFTGGVEWWLFQQTFLNISPLYGYIFFVFMVFATLSVMNVVTSIFVSDAIDFAHQDGEIRMRGELQDSRLRWRTLKNIFVKMDTEGTGRLTLQDFTAHMEREEVRSLLSYFTLDITDAVAFFRLLDVDMSGSVDIEEFVMGCLRLRGTSNRIDMEITVQETKTITRDILNTVREQEERYNESVAALQDAVGKLQAKISGAYVV